MRNELGWLTVISLLLTGCGDSDETARREIRAGVTGIRYLSGAADGEYDRVTGPRPFEFPQDHGAHPSFRTEWWYFTGNLFDNAERHFGFELTFFRVGLNPGQPSPPTAFDSAARSTSESAWMTGSVWMANFAVTDTAAGEFHAAERLSRGHTRLAYAQSDPLSLRIEDWYAEQIDSGSLRLIAATDDASIDLNLDGLDRIVLQGDRGFDPKGPESGNASHYYSAPRLTARGKLRTADGVTHEVQGTSWLDREWGTSALSEDIEGWDWFALQLSDGRDLMYYRLRRLDGSTSPFSSGSIIDESGTVRRLRSESVELSATGYWQSTDSGVNYPIAWQLKIPDESMELEVAPYLPNQEIDLSVRYWEGAVRVTGHSGRDLIEGQGYLELAGY